MSPEQFAELIEQEWTEVRALLSHAHARFPSLTVGELVHVAATCGGNADALHGWDAGVGAVSDGLAKLIALPVGASWKDAGGLPGRRARPPWAIEGDA